MYISDPVEIMFQRIDRMIDRDEPGRCMICGDVVGEDNLLPYLPSPDSPVACYRCCGGDDD